MAGPQQQSKQLPIEQRIEEKIDQSVAGGIRISTQAGMLVESTGQAMEVAKLMSISKQAVPPHCRNNPGVCFAIAVQSWEWAMNPFAVANKSYVVNDRIGYEAALYNAVATRRAPIVGRIGIEYTGSGQKRQCRIYATLNDAEGGAVVEYVSPEFGVIQPKNSPLWKNDPDQQLYYFSVRAFVRRHFPDVMMGVYTADELQDNPNLGPITVENTASASQRLAGQLGVKQAIRDEISRELEEASVGESQPDADDDDESDQTPDDPDAGEEFAGSDEAAEDAGVGEVEDGMPELTQDDLEDAGLDTQTGEVDRATAVCMAHAEKYGCDLKVSRKVMATAVQGKVMTAWDETDCEKLMKKIAGGWFAPKGK